MSAELARLEALGWEPSPPDDHGIRWCGHHHSGISYPRDVLGDQVGAGGTGFWLDARAREVGAALSATGVRQLWDVGAGSGAMAKRLPSYGVEVVSVEPLPEGAAEIASLGSEVFCGTLADLELPTGCLSALGLFDVLEHLEEPSLLLKEVWRVLVPGGLLVATVPAYQWLWSAEDEALGHYRRYSKASLVHELRSMDFEVDSVRSIFASLVPVAATLRTLPYRLGRRRPSRQVVHDNLARLDPGRGNAAAGRLLSAEHRLSRHVSLSFGLSVLAVAHKAG